MPSSILKIITMDESATPTPLHSGGNGLGYGPQPRGFLIQAYGGDVYLGDSVVTGDTDGFKIAQGEAVNIVGFGSRGTHESYNLTQIYYIGGPFKLILEQSE